jgi:flagellar basal body-associated protein FliL
MMFWIVLRVVIVLALLSYSVVSVWSGIHHVREGEDAIAALSFVMGAYVVILAAWVMTWQKNKN